MNYHELKMIAVMFRYFSYIFFIGTVCYGSLTLRKTYRNGELMYEPLGKTALGLLIVFSMVFLTIVTTNESYNALYEKIDEGYVIYMDRQEIDVNTIMFSQYDVSVSDKKETIYISPKKNSTKSIFIPFVVSR